MKRSDNEIGRAASGDACQEVAATLRESAGVANIPAQPGRSANAIPKLKEPAPTATHPADEAGPDASLRTQPSEGSHPATYPASAGAGGQWPLETQGAAAACDTFPGQCSLENRSTSAGSGEGHTGRANQGIPADPALLDEIRALWQRRQRWHRAEKSLTLAMKAFCRNIVGGEIADADKLFAAVEKGADHPLVEAAALSLAPFFEARAPFERHRADVEKTLERLAKRLPVWSWVEGVRGVGPLSVAGIVGECAVAPGDYKSVAAFWKRMGVGIVGGGRQRKVAGDAALLHGYAPKRRSLVWNIGEAMLKQQGHYREVYLARIPVEVEKAVEAGLIPATTNKATVESWERRGLPPLARVSKLDPEKHKGAGHIHNMAKRYAEKRFLRDFYAAWNRGGHSATEVHGSRAAPH